MADPGLFVNYNPFKRGVAQNTGMSGSVIKRGSLISFAYPVSMSIRPRAIHDPYPLVVVADIWPQFIRGVNLHYLTFPYLQKTLNLVRANPSFSYYNIRPDKYLAETFRMYNRAGMHQVKIMDMEFLLRILGTVRRWSEDEITRVTNEIVSQIQRQTQTTANQLSQQVQSVDVPPGDPGVAERLFSGGRELSPDPQIASQSNLNFQPSNQTNKLPPSTGMLEGS